jgi:hypothetical protein
MKPELECLSLRQGIDVYNFSTVGDPAASLGQFETDKKVCACVHVFICACMCACVHMCLYVRMCMYVQMCECPNVWMCGCVDVWMCVCVYVFICSCVVHLCICAWEHGFMCVGM